MVQISNREIIDVVRFSNDKAIIVEKIPGIDSNSYNVNYFILNFSNGKKEIVTKDAYLLKKFGPNRKDISNKLGNFVTPSAMILEDRSVLVVYPTGETGLFASNGKLARDGVLDYKGNPISSVAQDGEYFWAVCKNENAIVRYYADGAKVDIRIGGKEQDTFPNPHFISADDDFVYVCCDHYRVRKIDKKNFTVSDLPRSYADMIGYYKFGDFAIITTYSGAYCDKD